MDNRNEKLTHNLIYNSISLNENENILVEVIGEDGLELANEIIKQAKIINAKPHLNIINYEDLRNFLINATKEDIIEYGKKDYEVMKKMQAYIGISAPTSDKSLNGVSQEKLELYNKYYTALVHLEQRVKHTKWCILRYPNEYFAKKSNMTLNEFKDFYYNVCNVDYNKMKIAMEPLKELMNKTDKVHIVAPETDLTFSIKDIPAIKCAGEMNIPDGEVYTAPVKNSVNGTITYNTPTEYQGVTYTDVSLKFENGKIVEATANDTERVNKVFDTDEGARYVGEFAIGVNPFITKAMKNILFDEKIRGSIHFTPGNAYDDADNGNRSAIHWDLVLIQTEEYGGGEIYFDDVLIRKDGIFVLDELKCLNPENLI